MARHGENIYKRKDGRYEGRYVKGRAPNGRTMFGYVYAYSYAEVKRSLTLRRAEIELGVPDTGVTLGAFLENWMETSRLMWKPSTYAQYRSRVCGYILPSLGNVPLTRITREAAQAFCESLQKRGFCANTVRDILGVLNSAMKIAKNENLILANPCESLRLPQSGAASRRALDRREQALLEESLLSEGQSVELGVLLSLYAGLRIGEICALRWEDVDFSTHTLTVRGTLQRVALYDGRSPSKTGLMLGPPKSRRSFRSVPLPPDLSVILERRSGRGYVLTNCEEPVEPRTLRARFSRLTGRIGLPVPFHTLRHTYATRCLEHNFDFQTVAELLGHATADTTMRVYAHSVPEHKRFLTDRLRLLAPRYSHLSPPTSPEGRCAGC